MSYRQFIKEQEQGFPGECYLFTGKDHFFLKEVERQIREGVDKGQADFSLDIYDLDTAADKGTPVRDIIDSLNTFSFFSGNKTVIVQNVQKLKKKDLEPLSSYFLDPSQSSKLFLFHNDTLAVNRKKPFEGCTIISLDLNEQELKAWLSAHAKRLGISISSQALDFLCMVLGTDSGLLISEITKLSLLGKEKIDIDDLAGLVTGEAGVDMFEFTRAIISGNRKKAFSVAQTFRNDDLSMVLGAINWQVSKSRAKAPLSRRLHDYSVMLEADTMNKSTSGGYPLELLVSRLLGRK